MSPGGRLRVSPALGRGVDVAPPSPGQLENSSSHLSLPGKLKPSIQRRVRSYGDGSCDPQPAWGQCFMATAAVGHASPQTHSPPRDGTCQSTISRVTSHEPRGKHPPVCIPCTGQSSRCLPKEGRGEWGPDANAAKRGAARPAGSLVLQLRLPSLRAELGDCY